MSEPWPHPAPDVKKSFEKARDGKKEEIKAPPREPVTKAQIEAMEKEHGQRTAPQPRPKPPGARSEAGVDQKRLLEMEAMKQQLEKMDGKAREDFDRTMGR
jgi:ABC-type glutathione transport system ATPase component